MVEEIQPAKEGGTEESVFEGAEVVSDESEAVEYTEKAVQIEPVEEIAPAGSAPEGESTARPSYEEVIKPASNEESEVTVETAESEGLRSVSQEEPM